ncbi:MAG: DUF1778 domain-containing protein [Candidatus Riflebacteria bacterium]|nr:DUF1778 domain-containing protein [Candidatus Riflebacteria bacterium]
MANTAKRERLTIDLTPEEHRRIKSYAAYQGKTLKEFVLDSIHTRMSLDAEQEDLKLVMTKPTSLMMEIWDNDRDAAYDKL